MKGDRQAAKSVNKSRRTGSGMKDSENRKSQIYETICLYGASFGLPVVIALLVLKHQGFYPFGGKTLFIMDMKDQYLEFFVSLRNVISGDDSLFLSWSRSMGGNYLGLFAYYIASPLSFLTIFFPVKKMTSAILLLTLLKIGLAGSSFAYFADYLWKRTGFWATARLAVIQQTGEKAGKYKSIYGNQCRLLAVIPLAVSYALLSYNMVYSMCLMWLDGVIFLPMILVGIEKILDGARGFHYMMSLALLLYCNYYTGYMVGVFTVIYTIYRISCHVGRQNLWEWGRKIWRIIAATLLALGLAAPLLLPVIMDLTQGKLTMASYIPDKTTNFIFAELFGKLQNGVYDSITNSGLPTIYCGYFALLLAGIFMVLRRISLREKLGALLVLALLAGSFYFTKWDMVWHGFQYPTWFPYRYAFVCSFFLLYMALRGICVIGSFERVRKCNPKWLFAGTVLLLAVVSVDMGMNGDAMFTGLERQFRYCPVADYEAFLDKTQPLVELVMEQDHGFYRMNQGYEFSKNDAMLLGYHGMTHYSSTFHGAVNGLLPKLGMAQAHIWNSGYGSNPLLDSLFGVKYILDDGIVPAEYLLVNSDRSREGSENRGGSGSEGGEGSESGDGTGGAAIYANINVLPIAYGASCVNLNPDLSAPDPFANQNILLNAIAGTDCAYFTEYEYVTERSNSEWSYTFTADSGNPVYLYMKPLKNARANVYVNEVWVGNYFTTETNCSLYLGNFQPGQQVVVRVEPSGEAAVSSAMIAQLHMDLLVQTMEGLKANGMDIDRHENGKLSGKIVVGEEQRIITSIPYDAGWSVRIDGRKVEAAKFADTFLAIEAESGEHTISFSYVSPGVGMGVILFVGAVCAAVGSMTGIVSQELGSRFQKIKMVNENPNPPAMLGRIG